MFSLACRRQGLRLSRCSHPTSTSGSPFTGKHHPAIAPIARASSLSFARASGAPPLVSLAFTTTTLDSDMANHIEITVAASGTKLKIPTGLFINNEFVPSVDSKDTIQ